MANNRRSMAEFLKRAEPGLPSVTDGLKRELPIDQVIPRPQQPRRTFDPVELAQMAATLRALGMIQPMVVRPLAGPPTDRYEIVAGERRWRAAQLAEMSTVPVIIRHLDDHHTLLYSLAENVARSDLNAMDLARGYHRVVETQGLSQTELAEAIGQNVKTVHRVLRLLQLPPLIQALIEGGRLTAKHGEVLLSLASPARQLELAQDAAAQAWSVRELQRQIATPVAAPPSPAADRRTDHDVTCEQLRWSEQLGAAVQLRYAKTGVVRITITVTSLAEYQGIRERLRVT
jgi:ParB family chromosome partitioning protein